MRPVQPSKIVLIGASTGGPGVIEKLIGALMPDYPYPICIVQHFPVGLSTSFASRLQVCTPNRVVESEERLALSGGLIVVAKGGVHLTFRSSAEEGLSIRQLSAHEGNRSDFVPSVDDMFLSASQTWPGGSILAILLTGIGDDGVEGMIRIASSGGTTVCQNEESSPVFGMPARAIEKGAASRVLTPEEIIRVMDDFARS